MQRRFSGQTLPRGTKQTNAGRALAAGALDGTELSGVNDMCQRDPVLEEQEGLREA